MLGDRARQGEHFSLGQTDLLDRIRRVQAAYIQDGDPVRAYREILDVMVEASGSEMGFLDEVVRDDQGGVVKLNLALALGGDEHRFDALTAALAARGYRFGNMQTLAALPAQTREVVVSNDAQRDGRGVGFPPEHPEVRTFIGVPISAYGELVGVIGLANRPGGYDPSMAAALEPLATACAQIVAAARARRREREAEALLRESEARFRAIANYTVDLEVWIGLDGRFLWANPALERLTGYRVEELAPGGLEALRIIAEADRPRALAIRDRVRAGEVVNDLELQLVRKDGTLVWCSLSMQPIADDRGSPLGYRASMRDVSARREAAEALRRSLAEKEVLLREVHHRVKNNLAAVVALLKMQRRAMTERPADGAAMLDGVIRRIESMAMVHERLYRAPDVARIELGAYLKSLVSHLRTAFDGAAAPRCAIDAEGVELDLVLAVPCGLIVNELVTNAFKHAFPPGSVEPAIEVAAHREGDRYTLVVGDNGRGLPPGLDWSGAGSLGLRLVRMLGEHQLGGTLTVETSGAGTRWELVFSRATSSGE